MQPFKSISYATVILSMGIVAGMAHAKAEINVVSSIKPVHSLVAGVMEGVGTPDLMMDGGASPHSYALKPSQARLLQNADLVFWIGDDLETFLEKPIEGIATKAKPVSLMDSDGLIKIGFRDGINFEGHDHDDHEGHGHKDHDEDHGHKDHEGHEDHEDHEGHKDHDKHGEDGYNPHIWLDPVNAKAMVQAIATALSAADPDHADTYAANARSMMERLDQLTADVQIELKPLRNREFIVFHDAYQYYENRFGVSAIGSITVSPEVMPGAKRVNALQEKIRVLDATCVFSEPQFESKLVSVIIENTDARTGVLDPLGASIDSGPDLYFTLIRNMTTSLKHCLSD